jgi:hypothetical protein
MRYASKGRDSSSPPRLEPFGPTAKAVPSRVFIIRNGDLDTTESWRTPRLERVNDGMNAFRELVMDFTNRKRAGSSGLITSGLGDENSYRERFRRPSRYKELQESLWSTLKRHQITVKLKLTPKKSGQKNEHVAEPKAFHALNSNSLLISYG